MASIEKLAQQFLSDVKRHPAKRDEILRKAAYTFMGLAQDPKNARARERLSEVGLEFARAVTTDRPPVIEDFRDLLQETHEAYERVGPFGDDPMDLIAARREIHEERTPRLPGQVFITPESFNKDVTLGRSQKIKYAPTDDEKKNDIQQSQTVAFWQGFKKEAQAFTVDVNLVFLPDLPPDIDGAPQALNARPYAEVEFGSDGNHTPVRFDVAVGKRTTFVGNYCSVVVGMQPPSPGNASPILTAGASIGVFAAPSPGPTIYTRYAVDSQPLPANVELVQPGHFSEEIPVPFKAVLLLPLQTTLNAGDTLTIEWRDFGGNLVGINFYAQAVNAAMQPIPILGDYAFVRIKNTSNNATTVRLPFQLAL